MTTTVYVVTAGDNSEYRIMAAFSARDRAQAYMYAWPFDGVRIEEFPVDAPPEREDFCVKENCDDFCNNGGHDILNYTVPFGEAVFRPVW